jgi:hypothetical protein
LPLLGDQPENAARAVFRGAGLRLSAFGPAHASDQDHGPAADDNWITINISHAPVKLEMLT